MEKDRKDMMKKLKDKNKKKDLSRKVAIFFLVFAFAIGMIPVAKLFAAETDPGQLSVTGYYNGMPIEGFEKELTRDDKSFLSNGM